MKKIFRPISSAFLIIILLTTLVVSFLPVDVGATIKPNNVQFYSGNDYAWYNGSWAYRKSVTISRASGAVTYYQLQLLVGKSSGATGEDVDTGNHCQDDFDDLRFTAADGTTLLDYWIESYGASGTSYLATVWIEFDSIGTGATTFYMYYGNAGVSTASSGADTFITFDNFERGANGDAVGGSWTLVQGDSDISTEQEYTGVASDTRSAKLIGGATYPKVTIPQVAATGTYSIRSRFYKEAAVQPLYPIAHGDSSKFIYLYITADGSVFYYDTSGHDTGYNSTNDAWNLLEINNFDFTAGTYDIWLNGTKIKSGAVMNASAAYNNIIGVLQSDTTAGRDSYFDNFIVRNYRATEPAWGAWGAEEAAPTVPTVTTNDASSVEETTATTGGNITDIGGSTPTQRGVQYDVDSGAPYANSSYEDGSFGTGSYSRSLTSLTKGELYYFRAYATNGEGSGYGTEKTFLTKPDPPNTLVAAYASDTSIDLSWAKGTGAQKTIIRGKEDSYPANIADGVEVYNDTGVAYEHTGLTLGEHWYYRAWSYVTEGALEQWSDTYAEVNLVLANNSPDVTTLLCTGFNQTWAILNGQMTDDKGFDITSYGIQYGLTAGLGTTASTTGTLDNNDKFFKRLSSLKAATVYYYRAFATNSEGTGYDSIERFATKGSPAVYEYYLTGQDGNSIDIYGANHAYQTFQVGTVAHTITSVRLYLKRTGSPGDVTVEIRHATADVPTGIAIVSATIDADTMVSTGYSMIQFNFTEKGYEASTDYAIVVYCPDGDNSNDIQWGINTSGGYAGGVYGTSADGGVSWTDTADDAIFEIWGNPCIEIQDVKVFTGYKEANDWLITIRYINIYPPYYDTYDIRKYFTFDLLDLSSVVRGSTPLVAWGNRVGSLYLSAAQVGALEIGEAYTVRIYGLFGANPYTDYVLQPADYQGSDLTNLDSWVISSASVISAYYNTSMTTYIANKGEVLNSTGGTVMANGISGLATVRPGIFQTASAAGGHIDTPQSQTGVEANPQAIVGPQVWSWVTNLGAPVGADGRQILMLLFVGFYLIFAIWAFVPGQSVAANILGLPMIFGATYFGMSFIYVVILCLISGFLFVKHFWMDKRA